MRHRDSHWQQRDPEDYVTWHPVAPPQAVEGPLALDLFTGQVLVLELAPHQLAFREHDGQLRQVYFDGLHELAIGEGQGLVEPESRLFFLRGDVPVTWRWRDGASLRVDTGQEPGLLVPVRGECSLLIADPPGFHRAILQGLETLEPTALSGVLDTLVRTQIEARLATLVENRSLDPVRTQVMLNDLTSSDLDEDLLDLGLRCVHLSLGTPTVAEEPVTTSSSEEVPVGSYDDVF